MTDEIIEQIMIVRDTGLTNMFDTNHVAIIADRLNLYELVAYLTDKDNRREYCEFILSGKRKENNNAND